MPKIRELERELERMGYEMKKRTGTNHRQWSKGEDRITISGNPSREAKPYQVTEVEKRRKK